MTKFCDIVDFTHNAQRNTWTCLFCLHYRGPLSFDHAARHENTNEHQHRVAEYHAAYRVDPISGIAGPSEYAGNSFLDSLLASLPSSSPGKASQSHSPRAVNPPPLADSDMSPIEFDTQQIRAVLLFQPVAERDDSSSEGEGKQWDQVEAELTEIKVDSCESCLPSLLTKEQTDHSFTGMMRPRHQTRSTTPHVERHSAWAPWPDRIVNLNITVNVVLKS